jgi:hypothetical protein
VKNVNPVVLFVDSGRCCSSRPRSTTFPNNGNPLKLSAPGIRSVRTRSYISPLTDPYAYQYPVLTIAFLFGVMTLTFTCLICGYAPEWIPTAYTVQSSFYLTTRFWSYKRKAYHYFLFGESCSILDSIEGRLIMRDRLICGPSE